MTPAGLAELQADEGFRPLPRYHAFRDTGGVWTIAGGITGPGIGPNTVWTLAQATAAWAQRVATAEGGLRNRQPPFGQLESAEPVRADCLVNLAFNLGVAGLGHWTNTLAHVFAHAWQAAADDILGNTVWIGEVHEGRADRIAHALLTGSWSGAPPPSAPPHPDIAHSIAQSATVEIDL